MPTSRLAASLRKKRVRVQRDAVTDRRKHVQIADLRREGRVCCTAQQAIELFNLAALAFPAHPRAFSRVPLAGAVEQKEPIGVVHAKLEIERLDAGACACEHRRVFRRVPCAGIGEIAQDREVDAGIEIAQRQHLNVMEQRVNACAARQHRGNNHHRPGLARNAGRQIETWQAFGRNQTGGQSLDARDRHLARGQEKQQRDPDLGNRRTTRPPAVRNPGREQSAGHHRNRAEIQHCRMS